MKRLTGQLLDGKKLASEILSELKKEIKEKRIKLKLVVILVGNDPASQAYVKIKEKKCKEVGIGFKLIEFKDTVPQAIVKTEIERFNSDKKVTGIVVQLPLPKNFNTEKIINLILPQKDVDGLTKRNRKKLARGEGVLVCCAPKGIIRLLEENKVILRKKKIVLVGLGFLIGKPLALILKKRKFKTMVCRSKTKSLKEKTKKADILITATGVPHLIKEDYVKKGAVVVDAGFAKLKGKTVGDVDFERVRKKTSWITPVPGGVGPMTVAMLIENILQAYKLQHV